MKNKLTMFVALALVCMMVMGVVGCTAQPTTTPTEPAASQEPVTPAEPSSEPSAEPVAEPANDTPLVVAYSPFSEKFSPFFADTAYDQDAVGMTQIAALTTDRVGGIVYNAIEGETIPYNGTDYTYTGAADISVKYDEATDTTTYTTKLREDLVFSDGTPVTIDDLIFAYYVYLDPAYVGSTTLSSYDIVGLKNYQTQTTDDIYAKYNDIYAAIYAAGEGYTVKDGDAFTQEQYDMFWNSLKTRWENGCQKIVDYVCAKYLTEDYAASIGKTVADISGNDGLKIAFGMAMWGFAELAEDGATLTGSVTGATWDLATTFPTIEDYYNETKAKYEGDPVAFWGTETTGDGDVLGEAQAEFISAAAALDPDMAGGIPNVTGIKKIDQYTCEVVVNGFSAPAVYSICGQQVVPLHYYGDVSQYDYDNNMFGHPFGDLSMIEAKTTQPMGAGAYKFIKYENKIIYYEANELYYKGAPKIKYIQFKETASNEVAAAVAAGTVDAGEMNGTKSNFEQIASYNSNGEISGDVVSTSKVDNLGYGYIGLNADTVCVGGDQASDASKNLRKAFATVLAVYRDTAFDSYYGEAASVIQYPISNTSWAAPQATDEGYKQAFSVDVDGNDIYTSDMTADQKYTAALEAAKGFLIAAGYTFDEASGKFTAAPDGAALSYEVIIPGDGSGDHPSFAILTDTKAALETIGIELRINDPADSNVLWNALDAGTQNMWCAAWGATIDPDMYQVYHSSGIVGRGGSDSNHYHIDNAELDQLILDARVSDDQAYRKAVYKQCLDIIVDYAVEVPAYQRQNCIVFSAERINLSTLTPDITTFWGWMNDIELLEMN